MPHFGTASSANLAECHPDLQRLFNAVVLHWDCSVIDGKRTLAEQEKNVGRGVSQTLASKHLPQADGTSHAADVVPYPQPDWDVVQKGLDAMKRADPTMQVARFYAFAGYVQGVADQLGISIRQGVDWNSDHQFGDHKFIDLPHTELKP